MARKWCDCQQVCSFVLSEAFRKITVTVNPSALLTCWCTCWNLLFHLQARGTSDGCHWGMARSKPSSRHSPCTSCLTCLRTGKQCPESCSQVFTEMFFSRFQLQHTARTKQAYYFYMCFLFRLVFSEDFVPAFLETVADPSARQFVTNHVCLLQFAINLIRLPNNFLCWSVKPFWIVRRVFPGF